MGSPAIFKGKRTKLLTPEGLELGNGQCIDNDGTINYIGLSKASANIDPLTKGFALYNDGASAVPIDGTGGTATGCGLTRDTTAGNILTYDASFQFSKDASNRQGCGFAFDFAIPLAFRNVNTPITFYFKTSAAFVAGDMGIFVVDKDTGAVITPTISAVAKDDVGGSQYAATWTLDTNASANFRICGHIVSTNAAAYTLNFDVLYVGPGALVSGPIPQKEYVAGTTYNGVALAVTSAQAGWAVQSGNFVPYRTISGQWRLRFNIYGTYTAANITTLAVTIAGIAFPAYNQTIAGSLGASATATSLQAIFATASTANLNIYVTSTGNTAAAYFSGDVDLASQPTWADSQQNAYYGSEQVEYASNSDTSDAADTTHFVNSPNGSTTPGALTAGRKKRVQFSRAIQPSDFIVLEYRATATSEWLPVQCVDTTTAISPLHVQNTTSYGFGLASAFVSATQLDVFFAPYMYSGGATYASAGTAWATTAGYWRVKKVSSPGLAGFNVAANGAVGLLNYCNEATVTDALVNIGASAIAVTYKLRRVNNQVTLQLETEAADASKTNTQNVVLSNGVASWARPPVDVWFTAYIKNNNVETISVCKIAAATGVLTFYVNPAGGNWTAAAAAAIHTGSWTWSVN